jgi:hypothetical protein
MNLLVKYKIRSGENKPAVIIALLVIFLSVTSVVAEAKNNDAHQFNAKTYGHPNVKSPFVFQQVDYRRGQNNQYRYGDHYRAYKKKYHGSNNFPNKYYYPPHQHRNQHHNNNGHDGYNYRQYSQPLRRQHLHSGIGTNYWSAHKRHGYRHKRVASHHYYYNKRGFYFPGLGSIEHGHRHNGNCEDWHFSALRASSILLSIYNK